jgi:hypothetical protein
MLLYLAAIGPTDQPGREIELVGSRDEFQYQPRGSYSDAPTSPARAKAPLAWDKAIIQANCHEGNHSPAENSPVAYFIFHSWLCIVHYSARVGAAEDAAAVELAGEKQKVLFQGENPRL